MYAGSVMSSYFGDSTYINPWELSLQIHVIQENEAWYCGEIFFLSENCFPTEKMPEVAITHFQEIKSDVLSEGKEPLNPPVCPPHRWTSGRSSLYLWSIQAFSIKLYLRILWWFIFLVCFKHKYTHHIKYKIQSYRNLKNQLYRSFFHSSILKDLQTTLLLKTEISLHTSVHDFTSYMFIF